MDVDGGVELGAALVQVNDGLDGQRAGTFGSVKGEVPALAAGRLTLEPERAAEEDAQRAVRAQLGERALLHVIRNGEKNKQTSDPGNKYERNCLSHSLRFCPGRCRS